MEVAAAAAVPVVTETRTRTPSPLPSGTPSQSQNERPVDDAAAKRLRPSPPPSASDTTTTTTTTTKQLSDTDERLARFLSDAENELQWLSLTAEERRELGNALEATPESLHTRFWTAFRGVMRETRRALDADEAQRLAALDTRRARFRQQTFHRKVAELQGRIQEQTAELKEVEEQTRAAREALRLVHPKLLADPRSQAPGALAKVWGTLRAVRAEIDDTARDAAESFLCTVCKDQTRCVVFVPCSHLVCCGDCAVRVFSMPARACPICRQPISDLVVGNVA